VTSIDWDALPPYLNAREMAAIRCISVSQFNKLARIGAYDHFLAVPREPGFRIYSKELVRRHAMGEPIEPPRRFFQSHKRAV
jgi:hypothetical protein